MRRLLLALLAGAVLAPAAWGETAASSPTARAAFEMLQVRIASNWIGLHTITVHGDGRYEFDMAQRGRGAPGRYVEDYRLRAVHLRELGKLLEGVGWLAKPGAVRQMIVDGTEYTLTLRRNGKRAALVCCGKQPKAYEDLIRFCRRIDRQETLLYQATIAEGRAVDGARAINGELDAMAGRPVTKPYAPVLDYHRLVPAYTQVLADPADRHSDVLVAAARLMGLLKIESQRANLDALARNRTVKKPYARAAAVRALGRLGGKESLATLLAISADPEFLVRSAVSDGLVEIDDPKVIPALVKIASREQSAGWALIRLGEEAVPAIVEVLHYPEDLYPRDGASYAIIREYYEHWKELPKPPPPAVIAGIARSIELHGGGGTGSLVVKYGLRVMERAGKPYKPDTGRQIVARFLADHCSGDTKACRMWINRFGLDGKVDEQLVREAVWGRLRIADVHCADRNGWAVLERTDGKGTLVLGLHFTGGIAWQVSYVSAPRPGGLQRRLASLRKQHPAAKPVPPAAIEASIRPPAEADRARTAAKLDELLRVIQAMRTDIRRHPNLRALPTGAGPPAPAGGEARSPTPEEIPPLWEDLASKDPVKLRRAVSALLDADERALAALAGQVRGALAPVRPAAIAKLVADLSGPKYAVRTRTQEKLAALGILAQPALREVLKKSPPPETQLAIENLLRPREGPRPRLPKIRRIAMAMALLELAGTEATRKALAGLDYPAWRDLGELAASRIPPPKDLAALRKTRDRGDLLRAAYDAKYRAGYHAVTPEFTEIVQAYREVIERGPDNEIEAYCRYRLNGLHSYAGRGDDPTRQPKMVAVLFAGTALEGRAYVTLGLDWLQRYHNPAEAIPWFEKALAVAERTPTTPPADRAEQLNRQQALQSARFAVESGLQRCRAELASRAAADKTPWPDGVEGVQVRLRPDARRPEWLLVDMRNTGPRVLRRPMTRIEELQVDGQWYTQPHRSGDAPEWFRPGRQQYGLRLILGKWWRSRPGGRALHLAPGQHTVRVAITADPPPSNQGQPVRALSNAVDVRMP